VEKRTVFEDEEVWEYTKKCTSGKRLSSKTESSKIILKDLFLTREHGRKDSDSDQPLIALSSSY
jgi:hypothetical protein